MPSVISWTREPGMTAYSVPSKRTFSSPTWCAVSTQRSRRYTAESWLGVEPTFAKPGSSSGAVSLPMPSPVTMTTATAAPGAQASPAQQSVKDAVESHGGMGRSGERPPNSYVSAHFLED